MTFPTPQSALEYLQSKIGLFYRQSGILAARMREIAELKRQALARNDQETAGKLIVLATQTRQLLDEQVQLEIKLQPFVEAFGFKGLSAIPLVLIPVAAGIASLLYLHFKKIDAQGIALDLVKQGKLTASEAEKLLDTGLGFGNLMGGTLGLILPWAALLIGAYVFVGLKKD